MEFSEFGGVLCHHDVPPGGQEEWFGKDKPESAGLESVTAQVLFDDVAVEHLDELLWDLAFIQAFGRVVMDFGDGEGGSTAGGTGRFGGWGHPASVGWPVEPPCRQGLPWPLDPAQRPGMAIQPGAGTGAELGAPGGMGNWADQGSDAWGQGAVEPWVSCRNVTRK